MIVGGSTPWCTASTHIIASIAPAAPKLCPVTDFVEAHHVSTIYYETLVSPAIARTVGDETGAKTAVLDPIEGLSDTSEGEDYFSIMRANLANLRAGQGCT